MRKAAAGSEYGKGKFHLKKTRKTAAALLLAAAMIFQQCTVTGFAAETGEIQETQQEVQQETAPQTTQENTEATEKQTAASETEAPSAGTEAAGTGSAEETDAPGQSETTPSETSETKDASTEAETKKETDTEAEKETKKEEEASIDHNGDSIKESTVTEALSAVLPYLFAAETIDLSKMSGSQPTDDLLKEDQNLAGLQSFAKKLADGKTTGEITVLNVYADKDGKLDTSQLKEKNLDASNQYYVINIVASSKDQKLSVSSGSLVPASYSDETQKGHVLYSFTWYDADHSEKGFQNFEGSVSLNSGFNGTVLAPAAEVSVSSNFAGAVYAKKVTADENASDFTRIVLIKGAEEEETESESDTEKLAEPASKSDTEKTTEPVSGTEAETDPVGTNSLNITLKSEYKGIALTPGTDAKQYLALFTDKELTDRAADAQAVTYPNGASVSNAVTFTALPDGTYYAAFTDAQGNVQTDIGGTLQGAAITFDGNSGETKALELTAAYESYPKNFSYQTEVKLTMEVKDSNGDALPTDETFYAMLYTDDAYTQKALAAPAAFAMNGKDTMEISVPVTMNAAEGVLYLAETDSSGNVISADTEDFSYGIAYPNDRQLKIVCAGAAATAVIRNQLNSSTVKIRVEDSASGALLSGAKLVVKNTETGEQTDLFTSKDEETVWENKLQEGSYVLREITAPSGYSNTADVSFTVEKGKTTEAVMKNTKTESSNYQLSVTLHVYNGDSQVYARDTSSGTYAKEGRYTFYAALFSDQNRTKKVSDVQTITVSGLSGTTTFKNLKHGATYYIAETDAFGNVLKNADPREVSCEISYVSEGKVKMSSASRSGVIHNVYSSLPRGYRNTATITITKKLQDASGNAETSNKTFYAGIYRKSDYSDTPTVVALALNGSSEVSAKRRILLTDSGKMTYYIAEVDADGERITDEASFGYTISVDKPEITVSSGEDKQVVITNKTRISKVTLYLTKKVYQGTTQKAVNETFYAGLFKDAQFTTLYTKPIPMNMNGKSQLTLKLTLDLGAASGATIYVAEVDKDGNVVKAGADFGYDIRVVNATASFTQEKTEVQSILLNAVYSASSSSNWSSILNQNSNQGGAGAASANGSTSENGSVQTGDETPIIPMAAAFAVSGIVLAAGTVILIRRKKKVNSSR